MQRTLKITMQRFIAPVLTIGLILCPIVDKRPVHAQVLRQIGHDQTIYLTFDDGPSKLYTPKILDVLRSKHVPATFFVLGFRVREFPGIARRLVAEGHEVGNHGYQHEFLPEKTTAWVEEDVKKTDGTIHQVTGSYPKYYRPPGGLITDNEEKSLRTLGHPVILWTVDSQDWKAANSAQIVREVVQQCRPGAVILMHDGVSKSRFTVEALPEIIDLLRAEGYHFARLPQG
ncbi:polysaccharide deacetylase family protein [Alicyclobacillus fastidiosus]|uniref:Polysaccharide deacetylase family protein n=1 Tax=Alicyclobacillus fastidiosus TaxID=392011 RepID=A0ABV5AC89_9BACL|nr:polysaccharide deacetylase family protein [Alicyclobacillus fastidiosus]WEH11416.1 polysaccharide deacetylase family protein [Alicyclobacillus fastidiosus]